MFTTLYVLAFLLIIQGIFSLLEGWKFLAFVHRSLKQSTPSYTPMASVIAPCKGVDLALEENLSALFAQDYPANEIVFVVATGEDAALPVIERVIAKNRSSPARSRVVIAGLSDERSEKVNNLLCAIEKVSMSTEVFVFVDSDARVRSDWLRKLVAPLADDRVGAATGFRWYLPKSGGLFSALLSAWNGSVATTLGDHRNNFCWGGSTAIRRKVFETLDIRSSWQKAVSDDYALTNRLRKSGLRIVFVPRCMTVTREDASLASLLEFTTRQVIITRVYNPRLWWLGILSQIFFNAVFYGSGAFLVICSLQNQTVTLLALMLLTIFILGTAKGFLRLFAAREMLPQVKGEVTGLWMIYGFGWCCVSLIYLYNFVRSAATRRIGWRGVLYEMRSPDETIVVERARLRQP